MQKGTLGVAFLGRGRPAPWAVRALSLQSTGPLRSAFLYTTSFVPEAAGVLLLARPPVSLSSCDSGAPAIACVRPMGDIEDKKKDFLNGDKFNGRMIVNGPSGDDVPLAGVMRYKSGRVYSGTFLEGKYHGTGKLTFANGDVYEGVFVHGSVCGKAVFVSVTGTIFKGVFGRRRTRNDPEAPELYDTMTYRGFATTKGLKGYPVPEETGSAAPPKAPAAAPAAPAAPVAPVAPAEGDGEAGGSTGQADAAAAAAAGAGAGAAADSAERKLKPTPPPPPSHDGIPHAEILSGKGEIIYPNGHRFNGKFADGAPVNDGTGSLWIPVKRREGDDPNVSLEDAYIGESTGFGIPNGHGKLTCARGDEYEGEFVDGLPHGRISARYESGDRYVGQMVEGQRVGHGVLSFANGDVYEGEFTGGDFDGRGSFSTARDGNVFDGYFCLGERQGRGRLCNVRTGNIFDGYWVDGLRMGLGVSHHCTGERQEAWYDHDVLKGVPRIFFTLHRSLPHGGGGGGKGGARGPPTPRSVPLVRRVSGASLSAFCTSRETVVEHEPRPIRLTLKFVPAWLAWKRQHPEPEPPPPPVTAALSYDAKEGRIRLTVSPKPLPPAAVARTHLTVRMEPPPEAYLLPGARERSPPFDAPKLVPRVRLQLFAVRPGRFDQEAAVACAADLLVPPLLEWHVPPGIKGRVGDCEPRPASRAAREV